MKKCPLSMTSSRSSLPVRCYELFCVYVGPVSSTHVRTENRRLVDQLYQLISNTRRTVVAVFWRHQPVIVMTSHFTKQWEQRRHTPNVRDKNKMFAFCVIANLLIRLRWNLHCRFCLALKWRLINVSMCCVQYCNDVRILLHRHHVIVFILSVFYLV